MMYSDSRRSVKTPFFLTSLVSHEVIGISMVLEASISAISESMIPTIRQETS